ncbi:unnamed protein product, partial [Prorocentrum cordatum]
KLGAQAQCGPPVLLPRPCRHGGGGGRAAEGGAPAPERAAGPDVRGLPGDPNQAFLDLWGKNTPPAAHDGARHRGAAPDLRRDPEGWFRFYDRDNNGLQQHEVVAGLAETLPDTDRAALRELVGTLWALFDTDGSGSISMREFNKRDGLREALLAQLGDSVAPAPSRPSSGAAAGCGPRALAARGAGPEADRRARRRAAGEQLQELFPSLPPARIREALARCRGDKAAAADWLESCGAARRAGPAGRAGAARAGPARCGAGGAPVCAAASRGTRGGRRRRPRSWWRAAAAPPSRGAPRLTGRKRAVLIGINYFGTQAQLRGCINDVRSMQSLLEQMGWPRNCMRTLTDDQRGPSMPTRANIEAALRWLVEGVQPGDVLFFHFSGHGAQQEDPHGYEEDGMNETILPVDFKSAGMMTDDLLGELTVRRLPEGVRLTAVMDCCHSGTGLDLPYSWMGRGWKEDTNPYHTLGDVQMFSGCADDDTSADAATAYGAAGGAMTTAFCDVLRSNPGLPYSSLIQQLNNTMARRGFSQRAQLTSSQAFDFSRPFLLEDIIPNSNRTIGRTFRRKFPPRPRRMEGPLADMLGIGMAVMGGMMLGDLAGGLLGAFL